MSSQAILDRYNRIGEFQLKDIGQLQYYFGYSGVQGDNLSALKDKIDRCILQFTKAADMDEDHNVFALNVLIEYAKFIEDTEKRILKLLEEKEVCDE